MAKLYVESPDGSVFSHEITCSSFTVGGRAETVWLQHHIVLHNKYLILIDTLRVDNKYLTLPYCLWNIVAVISDYRSNSGAIPPAETTNWYVHAEDVDPNNTLTVAKLSVKKSGNDTMITNRLFNILVVGEIRTTP